MQTPTNRKHRRKFWFIPRFGLRTFLIVVVLLGAALAPLAHRTRQQIRMCEAIDAEPDNHISYTLGDPPKWLQFLPQSWLNAGGGHWCRNVESVSLDYQASLSSVTEEQSRALCKRLLSLASEFPRLQDLEIDLESMPDNLQELTDMLSPLANMLELQGLQIDVENPSPWILQALPTIPSVTSLVLDELSRNECAIPLKELLKFPKLEWVEFPNSSFEGHDLSPLAQLAHLQYVGLARRIRKLARSTLASETCGHVAEILAAASQECPVLHTVVFDGEQLDAAVVKELPCHIRAVYLRNCVFSTEVLSAIGQACPQLLKLDLRSAMVGCSLEPLLKMPRLNSLNVSSADLSADQLAVIEQLKPTLLRNIVYD